VQSGIWYFALYSLFWLSVVVCFGDWFPLLLLFAMWYIFFDLLRFQMRCDELVKKGAM